jgi:hypothetical protein
MLSVSVRTYLLAALACGGCQTDQSKPPPPKKPYIVLKNEHLSPIADAIPGRPCRVTVEGSQYIVGGPPLVMQVGADRWTGEQAENGTTLRKNDQIVARIHANQLFNADGVPILRVTEAGDVVDKSNAAIRKLDVLGNRVHISSPVGSVDGTSNVVLAAFLSAREALPEVRALSVCQILLTES